MDLLTQLTSLNADPVLVVGLLDMAKQQQEQIARHSQTIQTLELKNQKLVLELAHLKRLRFGQSSEALGAEQRTLFEEAAEQDVAAIEVELAPESAPVQSKPRSRAGRQPLPSHLERVVVRHEPASCTCDQCQRELVNIGEDVSEQLDIEPARFFVVQHIRPQYACRQCETISAAPIPPAVIDGGLAANGLYAWVLVSKYLDHLPLYRLEQIAERSGVALARSTLSEWIGRLGVALQPLVDRLATRLQQRDSLHADETPVQQLDPGKGKTKRAYLWAWRSNDLAGGPPIVVFDYQTSRSGQHARNFLGPWHGSLMVDDYAGYKELFRHGVQEQGCWAHARRKFFELQATGHHPVAEEVLRRIAGLYAIEAQAREQAMDAAQRQQLRAEQSQPELQDLHNWLLGLRPNIANGSGLAKAIDYVLRRWNAYTSYATSGDLPIDNNPVENAIRPIAIGKKNWLFAGSERAGRRAAAIQSLLATAKLNELDPSVWLKDTLDKLPIWPNSRLDELLPLKTQTAL
jgi:transposase